jgi:ABC-type branched-subunit amino acid transport system substrate-binding protein
MKRTGRRAAFVLASGLSLALAACSSGGGTSASAAGGKSSGSPLVVGAVMSESGGFDVLGVPELAGLQAGVTYYNAHGGADGHQIQLVVQNDQSTPALSATAVRKLVQQNGAQVIIGPDDQSLAGAAIPVTLPLKVPMLEAAGNWPIAGLSSSDMHSTVYPVIPDTNTITIATMDSQLLKPNNWTKVGLLLDNTAYALAVETPLAQAATADGFSVVSTQLMAAGATDATPQVLKLLAAHPDVIMVGSPPGPDVVTSVQAIRAQDPTIPIYVDQASATAAFAQAVGADNMKNIYIIEPATADIGILPANSPFRPKVQEFLNAMKAQGKYPTPATQGVAFLGWLAAEELVDAADSAKSVSATALEQALGHADDYTAYIHWDRTPSNLGGVTEDAVAVMQYQNGQYVVHAS